MATLPRLRPAALLRPRGGGRAHPARADPGRLGAPVPAPPQRRGAGDLPAPGARSLPGARRSACRCSRSSSCRSRSTRPGSRPGEADQLRQAMGSKRSQGPHGRDARAAHGRDGRARASSGRPPRRSPHKLEAFASFGFPESHSVSFAYLVYASAWMKLHHPAEFACALLNAQPMGFYSPHTIVRDARRHGVEVLGPCVRAFASATARWSRVRPRPDRSGTPSRGGTRIRRSDAMRVGLRYVRGLSDALLDRIDAERVPSEPFVDLEDFTRRTERAGRRVGVARDRGRVRVLRHRPARRGCGPPARSARCPPRPACRTPGWSPAWRRRALPGMERDRGDRGRPVGHRPVAGSASHRVRPGATDRARGGHRRARCATLPDRTVVEVAGIVTHRQQPETAKGVVFINLEDETGLVNVICTGGRVEAVPDGRPWVAGVAGPGPARTPSRAWSTSSRGGSRPSRSISRPQ